MDSCSWQEVPADPKDLAAEVEDLEDVPADPEDVATEVEDDVEDVEAGNDVVRDVVTIPLEYSLEDVIKKTGTDSSLGVVVTEVSVSGLPVDKNSVKGNCWVDVVDNVSSQPDVEVGEDMIKSLRKSEELASEEDFGQLDNVELDAAELGAAEIDVAEVDDQLDATEVDDQLDAAEVDDQLDVAKVDEADAELDAAEDEADAELDAADLGAAELGAAKLGAAKLGAAELGAAELGGAELDDQLDAAEVDEADVEDAGELEVAPDDAELDAEESVEDEGVCKVTEMFNPEMVESVVGLMLWTFGDHSLDGAVRIGSSLKSTE